MISQEAISVAAGIASGLLVGGGRAIGVFLDNIATSDSYFAGQLNAKLAEAKANQVGGGAQKQIQQLEAQLAIINEPDSKVKRNKALGQAFRAAVVPAFLAGVPIGLSVEAVQAINPALLSPIASLF